jgi:ubiquinone/menaquinone biosynthesis C-methylase UbiE
MISPERIFSTMTAYQRTQALKAAIQLDLFTAIDNGARTVSTLAESCKASERGIRILADYLVTCELLTKQKGGYGLTEESKLFLSRNSRACLGSAAVFLNAEPLMAAFDDLETAVRRGTTNLPGDGSVDADNPMWVNFARGMAPMMQPASMAIAKMLPAKKDAPLKVLDVAAGHGLFGIAVAQEYPKATVTGLDWKNVLAVASENAAKAGVKDRYQLLPGDAFEVPLKEQYDVVLITNFLHHFDIPTCENFLKKMHGALRDGGCAVTLEFVPNEDRVTPPVEAAFSLVMLGSTPSGDAYTASQLDKMFKAAGFSKSEFHALDVAPQHVVVSAR